ncbi:MAG: hypothetical protein ABL949_17180, partial [Fimbriimonadaceae bacterium]
ETFLTDATYNGIPTGAVACTILVLPTSPSGVCLNLGATSAGVLPSETAPTVNSPVRLQPGDQIFIGRLAR